MALGNELKEGKKEDSYKQPNPFGQLSIRLPFLNVAYDLISNDRSVHSEPNEQQSLDTDEDKLFGIGFCNTAGQNCTLFFVLL